MDEATLARVVRPGGRFFIYNLPQSSSYKEFVLAKLDRGYVHERKYAVGGTTALLKRAGWQVLRTRRTGMLPQNLTPMPGVRRSYNRFARPILLIDQALSTVPGLNYVAEALEFVAVKPNTGATSKHVNGETGRQGDKQTRRSSSPCGDERKGVRSDVLSSDSAKSLATSLSHYPIGSWANCPVTCPPSHWLIG